MKRLSNILFSTLFILSCGNSAKQVKVNDYTNKDIVGKWILAVKQVNYPSLVFNTDSTAVFTSMGDTIYRFKYYVDKTELVLKDINEKVTRDKILKLDRDSLVFETLADNKQVQRYKRK